MKLKSLICFSLLLISSASGISAYDFKVDGICYNVITTDDGEKAAEVTSDDTGYYSGEVVIPETVEYTGQVLTVVRVGAGAFKAALHPLPVDDGTGDGDSGKDGQEGHDLISVKLPNTVTEIGVSAFENCTGLTSVYFGEGLRDLGAMAFHGCESLQDVALPPSVRQIGMMAFEGCTSLSRVNLPEGLVTIGSDAFSGCTSLASISIPSTVQKLESSAFLGCTSLAAVTILTPECGNWFKGNSYIKEVTLGESVERIVDAAFENCRNLAAFTVTDNLVFMGKQALSGTAWLASQPAGPVYLGRVLYQCKGELPEESSLEVRDGTQFICANAFEGCSNLQDIMIPSSVDSIGEDTFKGCTSLESVMLPDNITTLPTDMFRNCTSLKEVHLPEALARIERGVFQNCSSLKAMTLQEPLVSIGSHVFADCKSLTSIVLPATVKEIDQMVFYQAEQLSLVVSFIQDPCSVHRSVFGMTKKGNGATLYIPTGTKDAYIAAGWDKGFSQIVEKDRDELETGIHSPSLNSKHSSLNCYDLSGRRLSVPSTSSVGSVLPKGVYIENGKKRVRN